MFVWVRQRSAFLFLSVAIGLVTYQAGPGRAEEAVPGDVLFKQGLEAFAAARYERAIQAFDRVLAQPKLKNNVAIAALSNRAGASIKLDRFQAAADDYSRALEARPAYVPALRGRAVAYMKLGQLKLAIADNSAVLEIMPQDKVALNNRGAAYLLNGFLFEAIEDFDRVIALEARGDYAGDISDFGKTKSVDPNSGIAHYNRANAYMRWGQMSIATASLDEFIWRHPENANGWYLRCQCKAAREFFGSALEDCKRALGLAPQNAQVLEYMGAVLERAGRLRQAIQRYREALQVEPALTDARAGLRRLNADL